MIDDDQPQMLGEEARIFYEKYISGEVARAPLVALAPEVVDHPAHYGGKDNPYEAIKVIRAWKLGFCLGNVLKYIARHKLKHGIVDLEKAAWYLNAAIEEEKACATARDGSTAATTPTPPTR